MTRTLCNRHTITTRDADWSAEDPEDVDHALRMISGDVPLDGWLDLADELLRRLNPPTE